MYNNVNIFTKNASSRNSTLNFLFCIKILCFIFCNSDVKVVWKKCYMCLKIINLKDSRFKIVVLMASLKSSAAY